MDSSRSSTPEIYASDHHVGSRTRLYFAAISVYLLHISTGCVLTWTSPVLPKLSLSHTEESLVGSLFSLGAAPGPIIIALGIDRLGRKKTLYVVWLCYLIGWIVLWCSTNVYAIYLGRIIGGIGVGGSFAGVCVYIVEIADDKIRGPLGSSSQGFLALGFLVEYCIGPFVSYYTLVGSSFLFTLLFAIFFYFLPETPHHLVATGRIEEAKASLRWLRGNASETALQKELASIEEYVHREKGSSGGLAQLITSWPTLKALLMCFFLLALQQGSTINALLAMIEPLSRQARLSLPSYLVPILVGLTNLVSSLPTPFLVQKFGIKAVFVASGFGMALCLGALSCYFLLIVANIDVSKITFLPVSSVILLNIFFCVGLGPLPWAIVAEMFPSSVKGLATCLCGVFSALFGFGVILVFSLLEHAFGGGPVFAGFALFLFFGTLGVVLFIPDTTKMSLQEIQEYLEGKHRTKK